MGSRRFWQAMLFVSGEAKTSAGIRSILSRKGARPDSCVGANFPSFKTPSHLMIDARRIGASTLAVTMIARFFPLFPPRSASRAALGQRARCSPGRFAPIPVRLAPDRGQIRLRLGTAYFTAHSSWESIPANRANVCASNRSSLRSLSPIKRRLRACTMITSCPSGLHGASRTEFRALSFPFPKHTAHATSGCGKVGLLYSAEW